jgi:hypothetical protein
LEDMPAPIVVNPVQREASTTQSRTEGMMAVQAQAQPAQEREPLIVGTAEEVPTPKRPRRTKAQMEAAAVNVGGVDTSSDNLNVAVTAQIVPPPIIPVTVEAEPEVEELYSARDKEAGETMDEATMASWKGWFNTCTTREIYDGGLAHWLKPENYANAEQIEAIADLFEGVAANLDIESGV